MNKADAIDILENSSSAANLLKVLDIIDHYEEPATFTNTPLTTLDLFAHDAIAEPKLTSL